MFVSDKAGLQIDIFGTSRIASELEPKEANGRLRIEIGEKVCWTKNVCVFFYLI